MRFSENRPVAWCVLAAAVILALIFGGGGALMDSRTALENQFSAPSESIAAELNEMRSNAAVLVSIANKYDTASEKHIGALNDAIAALDSAADPAAKYQASLTLDLAVENVYSNLSGLKLGDVDAQDIRYAYKNFTSAQLRISHDSYNTLAAEFNQKLSRFPAGLLGGLRGVKPLGLFQ